MTTENGDEPSKKPASARPGKAGRTDYDQWNKVTNTLINEADEAEEKEKEEQEKALGLGGKYARSEAEADERQKAKDVKKAKRMLDRYKKRESALMEEMTELLGPVIEGENDDKKEETKSEPKTVRVTRDMLDAGKRVVSISDTSGQSQDDTIVLTSDLSSLESKMKANMNQVIKPKEYADDAENDVKEDATEKPRSIFGIIKCFLSNVHNCTVLVKCKVISGTIEMSHCSNVVVKIEKDATVATIQADLCNDITIDFNDAPSGKNSPHGKKVYWGEDKEDRIFHAGVKNMKVRIVRDGFVETERLCDYEKDGAKAIGNASIEEFQFVTSVLDGDLVTESVVREGQTTGENVRAMTKRELEESKEKRERAAGMAVEMAENMIKFKEKDKETGSSKVTKTTADEGTDEKEEAKSDSKEEEAEEEIVEVYGSMSTDDLEAIIRECDKNKQRGNEAFGAGEYAQAILLYSLALDKADELPDADEVSTVQGKNAKLSAGGTAQPAATVRKQLFPRDVTLANRAACFLKLGQHEKAESDGKKASEINPNNVKAYFRRGLALHAMKQYEDAIPVLAKAHKMEPKNKQIKEALQFAEVRMTQEMRKRTEN